MCNSEDIVEMWAGITDAGHIQVPGEVLWIADTGSVAECRVTVDDREHVIIERRTVEAAKSIVQTNVDGNAESNVDREAERSVDGERKRREKGIILQVV